MGFSCFKFQKMSKLLSLVLIFLIIITTGYAQAVIKGKVIDAVTNQPIQGATVTSSDSHSNTITDKHGNFTLGTGSNQDSIRFTSIGYSAKSVASFGSDMFILL